MTTFGHPFRSPLFWRLLFFFCMANVLVLIAGSWLTTRFIAYSSAPSVDGAMLAQGADQALKADGPDGLHRWSDRQRDDGIDAMLFENGMPLQPMRMPPMVREPVARALATGGEVTLHPFPGATVVVQPITSDDGHARQLVAMSYSRARFPRRERDQLLLIVQLVLSLLLIGAIGWWVARSVSRPVDAMRDAARRMAEGEFATRVADRWSAKHDELGQLARDFNGMAERIEQLVRHDRAVLQDLSHELRSPLARLHLILDLAQHSENAEQAAAHFRHAEQEIARMDRMTGEMLALSRLEGGLPGMEREPVDLHALAAARVESAQVEAGARGIALQLHGADDITVAGSHILLERALDNLLANAIKFSPDGSLIEVSVRHDQRHAALSVRDHGPGVPPDEVSSLFRPFYRGSNAVRAGGHGLGLAIVQRVMQVHGGVVSARNAEGGGLEVILQWPLPAA